MYIDVKYERIQDLREAQLPKDRTLMSILVGLVFLAVIGLVVWANFVGVTRAYGMEAYTVMRVMEVKGEEVVLFSDDGVRFLVPIPEMEVQPFQEVLVVFHIRHNKDGNWDTLPEKGMRIEHVLK
jgi:hypothetical protein